MGLVRAILSGLFIGFLMGMIGCGSDGDSISQADLPIGGGHTPLSYNGRPSDPRFHEQFGISNTEADRAWSISVGDMSVVVAVIDTGVDYYHPDLRQTIWVNPGEDLDGDGYFSSSDLNGIDDDGNGFKDDIIGWNFMENSFSTMDTNGHGTLIAGIIAATPYNGIGIVGCVWNCRIMPVVARKDMSSGSSSKEKFIEGIYYAVDNGAHVINLSWGGRHSNVSLLRDAINYAHSQGVLVVGAAGNRPHEISTICKFDKVLCVSSVDQYDIGYACGDQIEVLAPSGSLSTFLDDGYLQFGGTSGSVPHVSALGAAIISHFPDMTGSDVAQRIIDSADIVTSGCSRINFYTALQQD